MLRGPCKFLGIGMVGLVAIVIMLAQCTTIGMDDPSPNTGSQVTPTPQIAEVDVAWGPDHAYVRYGEGQQVAIDFRVLTEHANANDTDPIDEALKEMSERIDHALAIRRDQDGTWVLVVDGTEYRPPS